MERGTPVNSELHIRAVRNRMRWKKIFTALAVIVAVSTISALILPAITASTKTYCGYEEHLHEDACYNTAFICTVSEDTTGPPGNHEHTEACYETTLTCTRPEHTHGLPCYSDPTADTESEEEWKKDFADLTLTGNTAEDLLAIAESQLGYRESEDNYQVAEDGVTKHGYTRYGAWNETPYAEWNFLFVQFCAKYAMAETIPRASDLNAMIAALQEAENSIYRTATLYTPAAGDLIFMDTDEDGLPDRTGIVSACDTEELILKVIEGDAEGMVRKLSYTLDDDGIVGYAQLSEEHENALPEAQSSVDLNSLKLYHAADHLEYQYSSHRVNGYMTLTYVLVPYDEYHAGTWSPNTLNWSAAADANYIVTYCADRNTDVSEEGTEYEAHPIEEAEGYSQYKDSLAGIVEHAYPFISAEEMRAELAAAFAAGDIPVDVSCCVESEFIAATQWAIWDMTKVSGTQTEATGSDFPIYNNDALNPLTDAGHTEAETVQSHVKTIRDWLISRFAEEKLQVAEQQSQVTKNVDGTYKIVTTVTLNRPLNAKETVTVTFAAGDDLQEMTVLGEGKTEFTAELSGLTSEEVTEAGIRMEVSTSKMQVYVYYGGDYQDMISGQWGNETYAMTFDIEVETTDVEVVKQWEGEIGAESVEIQLYADGVKHGSAVQLSAANNWSYRWKELLKYSGEGALIEYTVKETLIPGYHSEITKVEGGAETVPRLEAVTSFEEGKRYLLLNESNAIADETALSGDGLFWVRDLDAEAPTELPTYAVWTATGVGTDGTTAYLKNLSTGKYLTYSNSRILLSASGSEEAFFLYNHFYFADSSDINRYLIYLNEGLGYTTTSWDDALPMELYQYTEVKADRAEINYLITNTPATEYTSLSVRKEWTGRFDGDYPTEATVILMQNGTPYGREVTLNAANHWSYEWANLPSKVKEEQFTYTVAEKEVTGYTTAIEKTVGDDGSITCVVTNTWNPAYIPLRISKVDKADTTLLLPGATFELYIAEDTAESAVPIPGTTVSGVLQQTFTTGDNGEFAVERMLVGETYYLVETDAPMGYALLPEPIVLQVTKDGDGNAGVEVLSEGIWAMTIEEAGGLRLEVRNEEGYVFPETGGIGTAPIYLLGLLLIFTAVWFIKNNKKNKIKGENK